MNGGDGGGGCTGAHTPSAAAAATNSSNLISCGTTTTTETRKTKTPPSIDENEMRDAKKQRHHDHQPQQQHLLGQKRKYEEDKYSDWCIGYRENDKMFKCNYWEDPAYAKRLERNGLERARMAAHDNQTDRLLTYLESLPRYDPQQPPDPDRYRIFDSDYF